MNQKLPFFNWSLEKLLFTESDSFNRARISILFAIIILSLVKVLIVLPLNLKAAGQREQLSSVCQSDTHTFSLKT